jgi:LPS sulfotransferase NodH
MKEFIILTRQRTGSSLLIRSLDEHPNIFCAGEIFLHAKGIHHTEMQFPFIKTPRTPIPYMRNRLQIPWGIIKTNSFLNTFFQKTITGQVKTAGFKLMLNQILFFPVTRIWLNKANIKKIVLIRDNALDILISDCRARASGVAHVKTGETMRQFKITLKLRNIKRALRKIERDNLRLYKYAEKHNTLLIKYDELFDWNNTIRILQDYLEVSPMEIKPILQKRSKKNITDNIDNIQELYKALKGSKYEKYLPDNHELSD